MPDQEKLGLQALYEQLSTSMSKGRRESPEPNASRKKRQDEPEPSTSKKERQAAVEDGRRERLKRYRREMAGNTCIPDTWGKESLLKDWSCFPSAVESSLVPEGISLARQALMAACQCAK